MPLPRRLEKLRRFLRWRCAGGGRLPLFWHVGRPNFGDDVNPTFFERITGRGLRLAVDRDRPHLLGAGSILERSTAASVICGSGFLEPPAGVVRAGRLVAVRGERSAAAFPRQGDLLLGDPLVLVDGVVEAVPKAHRVGLVPHVTSVARWRGLNARHLAIIDPADDPWRVIRAIASCEVVLSQSLHGLIVADALGIPNAWIAPSDAMRGGRFKFDDYFTTLDAPKEMVPEGRHLFDTPERCPVAVGRYRFVKAAYRAALEAAAAALADELAAGPA
ncbi:MAG: polysaccharide pyruvyl transferase family protein [Pirellulales bacterium]